MLSGWQNIRITYTIASRWFENERVCECVWVPSSSFRRLTMSTFGFSIFVILLSALREKHRVQIIALSFAMKVNWRNHAMGMTTHALNLAYSTPILKYCQVTECQEKTTRSARRTGHTISRFRRNSTWLKNGVVVRRGLNDKMLRNPFGARFKRCHGGANFTLICSTINSRLEMFNGTAARECLFAFSFACGAPVTFAIHFHSHRANSFASHPATR